MIVKLARTPILAFCLTLAAVACGGGSTQTHSSNAGVGGAEPALTAGASGTPSNAVGFGGSDRGSGGRRDATGEAGSKEEQAAAGATGSAGGTGGKASDGDLGGAAGAQGSGAAGAQGSGAAGAQGSGAAGGEGTTPHARGGEGGTGGHHPGTTGGEAGTATGGHTGAHTGGASTGGTAADGDAGADTGGHTGASTSGTSAGGNAGADTGGASTGGMAAGGAVTGGVATGGTSAGGRATGGVGTGGANTGGAGGGGGADECPDSGGPTMVKLPEGYCIDSTEVTQAQYKAWLDTPSSSSPDQPSECSWNTSVTPTCDWDPVAKPNYPVVCVDWCDAYAYCQAVGKRLCGNRDGGANPYDMYGYPSESQWYAACSSGGPNAYPYGNSYDSNACNGWDYGEEDTIEVGTLKTCQAPDGSGYEGVFDLSGNVWEWEDSCDSRTGQSDWCRVRGGSFSDGVVYLRCDTVGLGSAGFLRDFGSAGIGFRCCAP